MPGADLTPREVADELGVTVRTVQRWVAAGTLQATRVGGRVRVSRSSLAAVSGAAPPAATPIRRLLIANRGEIAARIARTARAGGAYVIGLQAPDDSPPRGADETRLIDSYLDIDEVIGAAQASAADSVHPGYGFLAENPEFARAVVAAGLRWIGPPGDAIEALGDKANARRRAAAAGVPVVPGYDGEAQADATLRAESKRIGVPLLVKPTAGGGGKGMRVVRALDELDEALGAARREAQRAFGDDRLILERYVDGARHVEIQVLFDAHGSGVHLGERDCSTQRRNQKIIEEAPAPGMTEDLRARMGEAALRVAGSVGYVGAGTVEMLLADSGEFYFLEMNARLQVEHPVTEAVTGRDIVADQLRIAAGETLAALGLSRSPTLRGHAIEARVYAEDPESGFLPASGRVVRLEWPRAVRIDAGVEEGDVVGDRYDPMIAKLIAHGRTRTEALERLGGALASTRVLGVRTNVRFLRWLLDQPAMRDASMRTDTLAALPVPGPPIPTDEHWRKAAAALRGTPRTPWEGGWRLNAPAAVLVAHGDHVRSVRVGGSADDAVAIDDATAHVDVDGQSLEFRLSPPPSVDSARRHASGGALGGAAVLTAPMPGRVIAVRAAQGADVAAHAPVVVIEAMKMEHAVIAPFAGRITTVSVSDGQQVQRGDALAEIEPYHAGDGDG